MMDLNRVKHLNVFQYCKFLQMLGHVMVLLVLAIVGFSWFAVVPGEYGPKVLTGFNLKAIGSLLLITLFTFLIAMVVWSYFAAVLTAPGTVPAGWHPFADEQTASAELQRMSYADYYFDRRDPRRPRYCKRCQAWKPERAHHCSVLNKCILKMDHYCIWIVNCVGLLNYKFFLLFLFYAALATLTTAAVLIAPTIKFFQTQATEHTQGSAVSFIAVIMDGAFAVSLAGFLVMHGQLMHANCTTIEMYEKDKFVPWPYNRGTRRNFEEVFGRSKLRWFLPTHSREEKKMLLDQHLSVRLLSGASV